MKTKILIAIIFFLAPFLSEAQLMYQKSIGGFDSDALDCLRSTPDGGYILSGSTLSYGHSVGAYTDAYIVKVNSAGYVQWAKAFGGNDIDDAKAIELTSDGGYLFAGGTRSFTIGIVDMLVVKLDAYGNQQWARHYAVTGQEDCKAVKQLSDGGFIIAGESYGAFGYDVILLRIDSAGNIIWTKKIDLGGHDTPRGIEVSGPEESIIVTGIVMDFSGSVIRSFGLAADSTGNVLWGKVYGPVTGDTRGSAVKQYPGGYIFAGSSDQFGAGGSDMFLMATDLNGIPQWAKAYGGSNTDYCNGMEYFPGVGLVLCGSLASVSGVLGAYASLTDLNGNIIWQKNYGNTATDQWAAGIASHGPGFIFGGASLSGTFGANDILIVSTDASGNSNCTENIPSAITTTFTMPYDSGFYETTPFLQVSSLTVPVDSGFSEQFNCPLITSVDFQLPTASDIIFPNPANDLLNIASLDNSKMSDVNILNAEGKLVKHLKITMGTEPIDISALSPGIYFCEIISEQQTYRSKICIAR